MVRAPVRDPKNDGKVKFEDQLVIYPHELLSYLFNAVGVVVPHEDRQAYWRESRAAGEEWALQTDASELHCPLGIYGDSARLNTQYTVQKICGIFLNICLWRPHAIRSGRFLLWSCDNAKLYKNRTWNKIFRVLVWSLNYAFDGIFPTHNFDGTPSRDPRAGSKITASFDRFAVTELRGDWEWHKHTWRFLKCSWTANRVCFRCDAMGKTRDSGLLYYNAGPTATWKANGFTMDEFLARRVKSKHISVPT